MSVPVDDQGSGSAGETYSSLVDQETVERSEEERERKGCGGCLRNGCLTLLVILLILFLLLLFWPVPKSKKEQRARRPLAPGELPKGPRRIGNAKYGEIRVVKTPKLGVSEEASTKGTLVLVRFPVTNISSRAYAFDVYCFSLTDGLGREYAPLEDTMARFAEDRGKVDVWPKKVGSHKTVQVEAIFEVEKASRGLALIARDFDLRYNESITIPIPSKNVKVTNGKVE